MSVKVNKNVLTVEDTFEGEISIDNRLCQVNVTDVSFSLEQIVRINIDGYAREETNVIMSHTSEGPEAF